MYLVEGQHDLMDTSIRSYIESKMGIALGNHFNYSDNMQ